MEILRSGDVDEGSEIGLDFGVPVIDRSGFGQVYLTTCMRGAVKAWHKHEHQTDRIAIIKGMARLVVAITDVGDVDRASRSGDKIRGAAREFIVGELNPTLVIIPPGIWHGFAPASGYDEAWFLSVPSRAYNRKHPDEIRADPDSLKHLYDWSARPWG